MNESSNMVASLMLALNQITSLKDKVDPEIYELLQKSAYEAIASAHSFLDACEKAIDSLSKKDANDNVDQEISLDEDKIESSVSEETFERKES